MKSFQAKGGGKHHTASPIFRGSILAHEIAGDKVKYYRKGSATYGR